jgi:glutamate-1-semialdehyde 2,1-aminomutase
VIVEPVVGNMGCVPPLPGFLEGLRQVTAENGSLLIFDEVMTGFRVAYGGAQEFYGIRPDLTTLGKIIGGGLPVGAYGGRKNVMDYVAPVGPVYQAGTLSGNPLAVTAGITTLRVLRRPGAFESLERLSQKLSEGMVSAAAESGVPVWANRAGSMFTLFFTPARPGLQVKSTPQGKGLPVHDWHSAKQSDTRKYAMFFQEMLEHGVYLAPSQFEAGFVSTAHTEADIEQTVKAARESFASVAQSV